MIFHVIEEGEADFEWIDCLDPSKDELNQLAEEHGLHPASVKDCLSPFHLPKIEFIGDTIFMITRVYDYFCPKNAGVVQQLTNKVAIFITKHKIITIHRSDESFLGRLKAKWQIPDLIQDPSKQHFINEFLHDVVSSYDMAILNATDELEELENQIFTSKRHTDPIKVLYQLKRRVSIFKRMLLLTREVVNKYARSAQGKIEDPYIQDLTETAEHFFFLSSDLEEKIRELVELHISLTSHKQNEIVGMLTLFSVFFMPLTFVVGVYGMNFELMPETKWPYGYLLVWVLMLGIVGGIYWKLRKRGWIK